jgi:hypothetical protein
VRPWAVRICDERLVWMVNSMRMYPSGTTPTPTPKPKPTRGSRRYASCVLPPTRGGRRYVSCILSAACGSRRQVGCMPSTAYGVCRHVRCVLLLVTAFNPASFGVRRTTCALHPALVLSLSCCAGWGGVGLASGSHAHQLGPRTRLGSSAHAVWPARALCSRPHGSRPAAPRPRTTGGCCLLMSAKMRGCACPLECAPRHVGRTALAYKNRQSAGRFPLRGLGCLGACGRARAGRRGGCYFALPRPYDHTG